jgi:light-regulated signal transduction histidine kinase (bacteriophytochrome)
MLDELMHINNEQQNLIRRAEKKLSKFTSAPSMSSLDSFDELSGVNNELINAQRTLIKQNKEIMRLNNELKNMNKELEHFAHTISHDLKEPLRMVKSFVNLLDQKYRNQLDEKGQKYIYYAVDGAERMETLIEDLLDYSRVGRLHKEREKTDINDVLNKVVSLNSSSIRECDAKVLWPEMPVIVCQKVPVEQLFNNLLTNSLKYRRKDVKLVVEINVEEEQKYWLFSFSDNGRGIDPEYHKVIFDLFKRLDVDKAGTGMGLAICEKIVKQHGGEIWVESVKGEGSTFYFTVRKNVSPDSSGSIIPKA